MRVVALVILIALAAFLVGAGIVYFRNQNGTMSVNVDTQRLNDKTRTGVEAAKRLGQKSAEEMRRAGDKVREEINEDRHSGEPASRPPRPADAPANPPIPAPAP